MLTIKSNISSVRKKFQKYTSSFNKKLSKAIEDITNQFYNELVKNINKYLPNPVRNILTNEIEVDDYSFMNDIKIQKENDLLFKIKLGQNSLRRANDGKLVNPFYYYEFGFGIIGEGTYKNYFDAIQFGWAYDVNDHSYAGWTYPVNDVYYWTNGVNGLGFLQETVDWYKNNKEKIISDALKKVGL